MKLLVNNKYEEVGFWSFMKCSIFVRVVSALILYILIIAAFYISKIIY